jgi:two-component system, chemotaxis family, sensor kinase CheA
LAQDPYKYFRIEAKELLEQLGQGVLELERDASNADTLARLLRCAHTLKGAARVVKCVEIAQHAHALEEVLIHHRDDAGPPGRDRVQRYLGLVDSIAAGVRSLAAPLAAPPADRAAPASPSSEELLSTVRIDVQEVDELLRAVTEASVRLAALEKKLNGFERAEASASVLVDLLATRSSDRTAPSASVLGKARALAGDVSGEVERLRRELTEATTAMGSELASVREAAHQLRLVPARALFPSLERALYDAANAVGKRVEFVTTGGDARLDTHVLTELGAALLHIVRNAVAHGIEAPAERLQTGKPPAGVVRLSVERRAGRGVFRCEDDGRGVDLDKVRGAAVAHGLGATADVTRLSSAELFQLLLASRISTSSHVTEIAGRGIGLDAVRESVARLKGSVRIESEPQRGTMIELEVPVSLASVVALRVEAGGARCVIPLDAVRATLRLGADEIVRSEGRESIEHDGRVIPFLPLAGALRRKASASLRRRLWPTVVVGSGQRSAALGVEKVIGISTVIAHALPHAVIADNTVAGATLDTEGNPELVLDPAGLVGAAEASLAADLSAVDSGAPKKILVVDDSLTTRMLEQSILESAGYNVELAVSAEEALEKAGANDYGLFIVDVEMPGMDGFEFVARTRADPRLGAVPAILVTSRDAPEDRRRGERAGARAYVVKGEFNQGTLLNTIRELVG